MKKALLPLAVAAALFAGSASADYLPFSVNPSAIEAEIALPVFTANGFSGQYVEIAALTPTSLTGGVFQTQILYQVNALTDASENSIDGTSVTGLGSGYNMYSLMTFGGTFATSGTTTTFTFATGGIELWYDARDSLTTYTAIPTNPTGFPGSWLSSGAADDIMLATGSLLDGTGKVTCSAGNNCGSFGVDTTFALTVTAGENFFPGPRPFYNLALGNGQFDGFQVPTFVVDANQQITGFQRLSGSMNVHLSNQVPEPSTLALLGLGLSGLGLSLRRRKAA